MRRHLIALALAFAGTSAAAAPGTATLDAAQLGRLLQVPVGGSVELAEFPAGPGVLAPMRFERIDVYAPDARIVEMTASGEREIPRSTRIHLIGHSEDGSARVGISFDPGAEIAPYGAGSGPTGAFVVRSERVGKSWRLSAISAESALPDGVKLEYPANEDSVPNPDAPPNVLSHLVGEMPQASTPARIAVVAIDTDTTFMNLRFGGNSAQATAWIADLFAQVNLIYRRDLNVILQQGTTFLRIASDPYPLTGSPASSGMLTEFGSYWANNYSSGANTVNRSFAALLSGNSSSPLQASGIARVNAYCITQSGGSYSVNQIFTNPDVGVASTAFIVAHEIGHNFGAAHTHCSNASTGSYPTATGTIDQCFNGEGGCFAGTPTCPTSGPGAPKGTLMSYCHTSGANSASTCGSNVLQFHPTHVNRLLGLITANTPSCLRSELIFSNGFQ